MCDNLISKVMCWLGGFVCVGIVYIILVSIICLNFGWYHLYTFMCYIALL